MVILEKIDLRQFDVEKDAKTSGKKSRRKLRMITKSPVCRGCGLLASIVCLVKTEADGEKWQIYGERYKSSKLHLFTIDHILPKSAGGTSIHSNLQVMCEKCNKSKGDKVDGHRESVCRLIKRSCMSATARLAGRKKYKVLLSTYGSEFSLLVDATNSFLSAKLSHEPKEITDGKNRKTKKQKRAKRNQG